MKRGVGKSCLVERADDAVSGMSDSVLGGTESLVIELHVSPLPVVGIIEPVDEIGVTRQGNIVTVAPRGEFDLANVDNLDATLKDVLQSDTTSCLLDLSGVTFLDSSVLHALVRWSKEAQVSDREALAIMVGGEDTAATRTLGLVGLLTRLPVFATIETATLALQTGQKPRAERPLQWLSDMELAAERDAAQTGSDAATQRLDEAIAEQDHRRESPEPPPDS
jgi:anti-anti-sigma factor